MVGIALTQNTSTKYQLLEIFVLARTVELDSIAEGLHSSGEATCEV